MDGTVHSPSCYLQGIVVLVKVYSSYDKCIYHLLLVVITLQPLCQ